MTDRNLCVLQAPSDNRPVINPDSHSVHMEIWRCWTYESYNKRASSKFSKISFFFAGQGNITSKSYTTVATMTGTLGIVDGLEAMG